MSKYLSKTTEEMYRWFGLLNDEYFNGELEEPIITIQKTRRNTLGWFVVSPCWWSAGEEPTAESEGDPSKCRYEINISAQALELKEDWDIVDLVSVLLHECVHYHCKMKGIKDCSGRIHNKKFKAEAEKVGLIVEKGKSVGWGLTKPSDNLREWIKDNVKPDASSLMYYRYEEPKPPADKKPKIKYTYSCACGKHFDMKKKFNLICGDCNQAFDVEEDEG